MSNIDNSKFTKIINFCFGFLYQTTRRYESLSNQVIESKDPFSLYCCFFTIDGIQDIFDENNDTQEFGLKKIYYSSIMGMIIVAYNLAKTLFFEKKFRKNQEIKNELNEMHEFILKYSNSIGIQYTTFKISQNHTYFKIGEIKEISDIITEIDFFYSQNPIDIAPNWFKKLKRLDEIIFDYLPEEIKRNYHLISSNNVDNRQNSSYTINEMDLLNISDSSYQPIKDFFFKPIRDSVDNDNFSLYDYCKDFICYITNKTKDLSSTVIANIRDMINHFARLFYDMNFPNQQGINENIGEIIGHLQRATIESVEYIAQGIRNKFKFYSKVKKFAFYLAFKKNPFSKFQNFKKDYDEF